MNCVIVPAAQALTAMGPAAPVRCDSAERFAELVRTEPQREIVYVEGPAQGSGTNPVLRALSAFQSAEVKMPDVAVREEAGSGNADTEGSEFDRLAEMGHDALFVQMQILRTTLMMETVSAAKQGVTTLFQQQG